MPERARGLAVLAAGAAGSWLAAAALPGGAADPLRGTLVLIPAVVAALHEIGRAARRRGGRRGATSLAAAELTALAVLVVAALGRRHLGLAPGTGPLETLLAAGLCFLLLLHVARLLPALRPLLGRALPDRPHAVFLLLPLTVYLALIPWSSGRRPPDGDEPHYLLITHSLAYDFDADLTDNYAREDSLAFMDRALKPQPGDPKGPGGELLSRHNLLLPLVLAPAYRLAGRLGALATMALLSAALAWMVLRLARRYVRDRPGEALAAWAVVAFLPPLLLYSHQVWVEVPAALLAAWVLDEIHRLREASPGWLRGLAAAAALALLPLLKLRFLVVAGSLLLLAAWRTRAWKPVLWAGGALTALGLGILAFNQVAFGTPLKYQELESLRAYWTSPLDYAPGILGLFWDNAFGLFAAAPIWLLLLAVPLVREARGRMTVDLLLFCAPLLLLLGPRLEWYGGWSPPFRYGLVLLPLLAVALAPVLVERRRPLLRVLVAALGVLTLVATLHWVAHPGWTYNLAHGRGHLLDFLSTRLGTDVARFFPSMVRPRLASWIWPPATALLVAGALWRLRARIGRAAVAWGLGALLLGAAGLVGLAERLPTRVLEFEDPLVRKTAGKLYPPLWVIGRTIYRGGWLLPPNQSVSAPVVAGGSHLSLELDLKPVTEARSELVLRSGDTEIAARTVEASLDWQTLRVESLPWTPGASLTIELALADASDTRRFGRPLILDRARLSWH